MCIAYRPKFDVLTASNFGVVTSTWRVCCPLMYVAYRPTFDVQLRRRYDGGVDRRCIDVAYMLSDVATLFQPIFDVETTLVCLLGCVCA